MLKIIQGYDISKKSIQNIKIYYTNSIILSVNNLKDQQQKKEYIKEIKKRKIIKNIKARNVKQLVKKILLCIDIRIYLKLRK